MTNEETDFCSVSSSLGFGAESLSLSLWAAVWLMLYIWRSAEAITHLTRSHKSPYTDDNVPLSVSRLHLAVHLCGLMFTVEREKIIGIINF